MTIVLKKGASKATLKKVMEQIAKAHSPKGVDVMKYCGAISIKEDAVDLQKKWRDEWE